MRNVRESGNIARLSTVNHWTSAFRVIATVCLLGSLAGCGLRSDEDLTATVGPPATQPSPLGATTATASGRPTREPADKVTTPGAEQTAEQTSSPAPTIAVAELQPSTKLAYFHTTAADGDSAAIVAQQASFVILTHGDDRFRDALRAQGYTGLILQYLNASQVNGPGPYRDGEAQCDDMFTPLRNGFVRDTGAFCRDLHPHEDWFLHNQTGDRLYSVVSDAGVWYHMNPGNPDWRAYASQAIAADVIGPIAQGYDGAFLDNVELSLTKLSRQVDNADGGVREFGADADYRDAWHGYLQQIRARVGQSGQLWAGLISDPNTGTFWTDYLAYLDGVMSPAFATGYDPLTVGKWENNLEQAEAAINDGKGLVAVGLGQQDDARMQQFALASYLLIADGDRAYFRYLSDEMNNTANSIWMYPNYGFTLGASLGPRQKIGSIWRRAFQCGYVEVNPASRDGTIVTSTCSNETTP